MFIFTKVITFTSFKNRKSEPDIVKQHMCAVGGRYLALDFHKAPWADVRSDLAKIDWEEMKLWQTPHLKTLSSTIFMRKFFKFLRN